ncbi:MAG TPA: xylulokinase [Ruminococcus sp.]|nr:xylulokinase [Ruminococcus sp.]
MAYLIGIDCGTSGTKAVLFDENGRKIASDTAEYPLYQPKNGYAEQVPADWKNAMLKTVRTVVAKSGVRKEGVKGIGIAGQMHGLVLLDRDNNVLRPSIIWCDQRTAAEAAEMEAKVGRDKLVEITANPALTGWTAAKLLWVKNNEPDIYSRIAHVLLPKDYLRFILTGEYATDVSDASGMQLFDVPARKWSDELISAFEAEKSWFAKVYESCEITGRLTKHIADELGLCEGTAVVGGAGDNAAAAVGTGVISDGKAFTTIGTSGVVFAHTSSVSIDKAGRVHTCCAAVPGEWHVMGVTQSAGLSLKWFRDNFCGAEKETARLMGTDEYVLMDREAESVPVGANRLLYLPYLMGERTPHLDPDARGVFFGLSAIHTKRDMLRAVMEGVAYSLRDCVEVFRDMDISINDMMACGGGGRSELWRSMLADMYKCPVRTIASEEGPALGAAILASVGTDIYSSVHEACGAIVRTGKEQLPDVDNSAVYERYYQLYRELYPVLKEKFSLLADIERL